MKKIILLILLLLPVLLLPAQQNSCLEEAKAFREKLNSEFRDSTDSPLTREDRAHFKKLKFFKFNPEFCVKAEFVQNSDSLSFQMPTSNPNRSKPFVKTGVLKFRIQGRELEISVYKNLGLAGNPEYQNYLFIPFKDLTTANETYGGGRYIDLTGPLGEIVILDFNQCYNPYCAYSTGWSCPVPPKENELPVAIRAGVKAWKH